MDYCRIASFRMKKKIKINTISNVSERISFKMTLFWAQNQGRIQADAIDANASVRKKMPMHSSVRLLSEIMKNNTFCENTRLKMHKFQQSYYFLEMSTKHIPKFI